MEKMTQKSPSKWGQNFYHYWNRMEQVLGGMKLAIVLILLFVIAMITGTIMESYHGTEYANRLIYKSLPFMILQFFLFLSITFAMLMRLPPKKRLYGFYTIHIGLILVLSGSFITFYAGIDGNITLFPNTPTREITLSDEIFSITFPDRQKRMVFDLPFDSGPTEIGEAFEDIELQTFYPFSENKLHWIPFSPEDNQNHSYHSSQYLLRNDNVSQNFTMSLHPQSAETAPSSLSLGPLSVHYLPREIFPCFETIPPSRIIVWDSQKKNCFTPEGRNIPIKETRPGNRFFVVMENEGPGQKPLTFFPDYSPWPLELVNNHFQVMENSHLRVFSAKLFEEKPHLFLFGQGAAFFVKGDKRWETHQLSQGKDVPLPWMNFLLQLTGHFEQQRPEYIPQYVKPIQQDGETLVGNQKSLKVKIKDQVYWVNNTTPLNLMINGEKVLLELKKQTFPLPYELNLDNFKMDQDPGTTSPASYESFTTLFHSEGYENHHIYMNNPLKKGPFTFYQASYFQTENGYGSVLSVNFDPGRPIKYLGSLLLVLGAIAHYQLNRSRQKKGVPSPSGGLHEQTKQTTASVSFPLGADNPVSPTSS